MISVALISFAILAGASDDVPVKAELITSVATVVPGRAFTAAVRLRIRDGWHIYWMNPGDAGLATEVRWRVPSGFIVRPLSWPAPERYQSGDAVTYAHTRELVLLAEIVPPAALSGSQRVSIEAEVRWGACADVCVPGDTTLRRTLSSGTTAASGASQAHASSDATRIIADARSRLPRDGASWRASTALDGAIIHVVVEPTRLAIPRGGRLEFFPARAGAFATNDITVTRMGDKLRLRLRRAPDADTAATRVTGVLTWSRDGERTGAAWLDVPLRQTVKYTNARSVKRSNGRTLEPSVGQDSK